MNLQFFLIYNLIFFPIVYCNRRMEGTFGINWNILERGTSFQLLIAWALHLISQSKQEEKRRKQILFWFDLGGKNLWGVQRQYGVTDWEEG